jgi:hypothetical protein
MLDVILKRFEAPDETRFFNKGKFEIVRNWWHDDWQGQL